MLGIKSVTAHAMTIRDPDACEAMIADTFSRHGKLDLLVNNAGGQYPQAAIDFTMKLHNDAGKTAAHVKKDVPGFIGNRLQHALWREAVALVEHGICDAETVAWRLMRSPVP